MVSEGIVIDFVSVSSFISCVFIAEGDGWVILLILEDLLILTVGFFVFVKDGPPYFGMSKSLKLKVFFFCFPFPFGLPCLSPPP